MQSHISRKNTIIYMYVFFSTIRSMCATFSYKTNFIRDFIRSVFAFIVTLVLFPHAGVHTRHGVSLCTTCTCRTDMVLTCKCSAINSTWVTLCKNIRLKTCIRFQRGIACYSVLTLAYKLRHEASVNTRLYNIPHGVKQALTTGWEKLYIT